MGGQIYREEIKQQLQSLDNANSALNPP